MIQSSIGVGKLCYIWQKFGQNEGLEPVCLIVLLERPWSSPSGSLDPMMREKVPSLLMFWIVLVMVSFVN